MIWHSDHKSSFRKPDNNLEINQMPIKYKQNAAVMVQFCIRNEQLGLKSLDI